MPVPTSSLIVRRVPASTLEQTKELATAKGLWLIANVIEPSSAECKMMEDTSWRSPEVVAWINRSAFFVEVSVDQDRDVAKMLNTRAVPTVIAFQAGEQRDRIVGFREATELATWLSALGEGPAKPDLDLRHSTARMQLDDKLYDDATKRYVWIWNNIPGSPGSDLDPGWMDVRRSYIAEEIRSLVAAHPPAHALFGRIRDASGVAAPAFDSGDWFGPRVDWVILNRVLGEEERTIDWFNGVGAEPTRTAVIEHVGPLLVEPLKERGRWADIGRLFRHPQTILAETHETMRLAGLLGPNRPGSARLRSQAATFYAALTAAGRVSDAKAFHQEAIRLDSSDEMRRALEQARMQ